jgi:hypothetical protein
MKLGCGRERSVQWKREKCAVRERELKVKGSMSGRDGSWMGEVFIFLNFKFLFIFNT